MRYLLLLTNTADEIAAWEAMDAEAKRAAREAEVPRWNALFERLHADGRRVEGVELDTPEAARTIRHDGEEPTVTDGPYAETREQLGGFLLVDCESLDEAIAIAELVPAAQTGSVEIRPLAE